MQACQYFDLTHGTPTQLDGTTQQLIALADVEMRLYARPFRQEQCARWRAQLQARVDRLTRPQIGRRRSDIDPPQQHPYLAVPHLRQGLDQLQCATAGGGLLSKLQTR